MVVSGNFPAGKSQVKVTLPGVGCELASRTGILAIEAKGITVVSTVGCRTVTGQIFLS